MMHGSSSGVFSLLLSKMSALFDPALYAVYQSNIAYYFIFSVWRPLSIISEPRTDLSGRGLDTSIPLSRSINRI
ncbi:hypothetical protein BD779DRAFT_1565173 [Infundibulicybe gibba]|nr:hypothetical protein BD779DRAFT_1565173 [Infundibulicybe gibba]